MLFLELVPNVAAAVCPPKRIADECSHLLPTKQFTLDTTIDWLEGLYHETHRRPATSATDEPPAYIRAKSVYFTRVHERRHRKVFQ